MLVRAVGLRKGYKVGFLGKRRVEVLKGVDLSVDEGETVALVGESGSGKTTLGLLLAGLLKPDEGKIYLSGEEVSELLSRNPKAFRRQVQVIFQHPESAFNPKWKLRWSLAEPYRLHKIPFTEEALLEHLRMVGLSAEHLDRYPHQLSGGELQRAAIARVMVLRPRFVVLDEPTSMLDAITQAQIIRLLEAIQRETGVAYLFISHDLELVRAFCGRIYCLEGGRLREERQGEIPFRAAGRLAP